MLLIHYLKQETDLLDGFRADCVVPIWFKELNPMEKFTKPRPEYVGPNTPEVLERIAAWNYDPIFDLAKPGIEENFNDVEIEGMGYYELAVKEWNRERFRWRLAQELTLLRKWIFWITKFTNMDLFDNQVMEMAGLIPPDEE